MTITFNLSERAAASLLASAQAQGRPQSALIAEALEERYGLGTAAAIAEGEDDLYSAAARHKLTDGFGDGRLYALEETMNPEAMAALEQEYGVAAMTGKTSLGGPEMVADAAEAATLAAL